MSGGYLSGGNCPGGNCPGGNCPDTPPDIPYMKNAWPKQGLLSSQVNYGKCIVINMQKLVWGAYQISHHKRMKLFRNTQLLVLSPVEPIFFGNLQLSLCTHAQKKSKNGKL